MSDRLRGALLAVAVVAWACLGLRAGVALAAAAAIP